MAAAATPARSWPPRSRHRAPASPRSSASGRSPPPPSSATSSSWPGSEPGTTSPPATAPPRAGGVLRPEEDLPAVAARQPASQPRDPHGRDHPDPAQTQRRPRLLPAEDRRREDPQGGAALPET